MAGALELTETVGGHMGGNAHTGPIILANRAVCSALPPGRRGQSTGRNEGPRPRLLGGIWGFGPGETEAAQACLRVFDRVGPATLGCRRRPCPGPPTTASAC